MTVTPPDRVVHGDVVIRRWRTADAPALHHALIDSLDHLRPWMPWAVNEPRTLADHEATIDEWVTAWDAGDDFTFVITDHDDHLLGACGLHRRLGNDAFEIGYWVRSSATRRGVATAAAAALAHAAFTLPHIAHVEIHHDAANIASGAVPARLGFTRTGEYKREPAAPAEVGTMVVWRLDRPNAVEVDGITPN